MTFTAEQLKTPVRSPLTIKLPSGATMELQPSREGVYVYYFVGGKIKYQDSADRFSSLAQILQALAQEVSKIPEEDQTYLKTLLPKERERSTKKEEANPDACPFCGAIGQPIDSRALSGTLVYPVS